MLASHPLPQLVGRVVTQHEIWLMLQAAAHDLSFRGSRDAAILTLGVACGLRRAEIAGLTTSSILDPIPDFGVQTIPLHVLGKGGRHRLAYLSGPPGSVLISWLRRRGSWVGPLLVRSGYRRELTRSPLSPHGVWRALGRLAARASVAHFTPHDLRRTFITTLLTQGVDIALVARLAGHASIQTTALYDRRSDRLALEAVQALPWPAHSPPHRQLGLAAIMELSYNEDGRSRCLETLISGSVASQTVKRGR